MKENFIICIEAVIPMFCTLAIGYLIRMSRMVTDEELNKFNLVIFYALFPLLNFSNVYSAHISEVIHVKLILFVIAGILGVYFLGLLFSMKISKESKTRGAMTQAIYRSNFLIMGLPIATNIYGHSNVGITAVMIAIVIPMYNVLAVITLETFRGNKANPRRILLGIAKNPLILGTAAGVLFSLLGLELPSVLDDTVVSISSAASTMALIILGASFQFGSVRAYSRNLAIIVFARLIAVPGICLTAASLLGFRDITFITIVSIFAAPCAVSAFTMALEMDSDAELAGSAVIFTSAFACLTMFGWLFLFKNLGMF